MKKKVMLILSCLLLSIGFITAQTTRVSGIVVDDAGEPVIGASVAVKGTTVGVMTDVDGKFSINVPSGRNTLVFTLVGMKTVEARVSQDMRVVMEIDENLLDEIEIVVPYGTAKKTSYTGSAEVITNKTIERKSIATVSKALDGTIPGVRSTTGGGQPGSDASIILRGYGSLNASNNPLYVVDGVPYGGSLSSINPSDIESVSVLKDATASTMYGNRGANGVIMITTKKGRDSKASINLRATWGVSSRAIPRYETVNAREYMELAFEAYKNDRIYGSASGYNPNTLGQDVINDFISGSATLGGEKYNPFNYSLSELFDPNTGKVRSDATLRYSEDWVDEILASNPLRQEYNLSVSGGNSTTKYYMSLGYLNEEGLLQTTSFDRYSARLNLDNQATDWMKIGLSSNFASTKSNFLGATGSASSNVWYSAQFVAPIYPMYMYDANGLVLDQNGNKQYDYGVGRPVNSNSNPLATLYDDHTRTVTDNLSARTYVELTGKNTGISVLEDLSFMTSLGVDYTTQNYSLYYNRLHGNASTTEGRGIRENYRYFVYTWNQQLSYDKQIGNHNIGAKLIHEFYSWNRKNLSLTKTGFPFNGLYELGVAATLSAGSSVKYDNRIDSYLGSLNYSYMNKYYANLSYRRDASSRFHKDNRWGNFWAAGASWRISEESFMQDITSIDNLTLKASYGTQGNDAIDTYYGWQGLYSLGWNNNSLPGGAVSTLQNPDLSWEKSQNFNVGIEGRFFNKLSATVEYYHKKTTDMLLEARMAPSTGFSSYWANIGDMKNYGLEFSLAYDAIRNQDFTWRVTLTGSHTRNKVLHLTEDAPEQASTYSIIKEGETVNSFYLVKSAGVDPLSGKQLYWAKDADGKEYATTEFTVAQSSNKTILGNRIPDIEGGLGMDFTYKGFDFSFQTAYSLGGKILDLNYATLTQGQSLQFKGNTFHKDLLDAWKNPGDISDFPMVSWNTDNQPTDRYLVNASYFAIRNAVIGYTIPKQLTSKWKIENIRLFAQADNIYTFTHLKGMDPQFNLSGIAQNYSYINNRVVSFGVDIKF